MRTGSRSAFTIAENHSQDAQNSVQQGRIDRPFLRVDGMNPTARGPTRSSETRALREQRDRPTHHAPFFSILLNDQRDEISSATILMTLIIGLIAPGQPCPYRIADRVAGDCRLCVSVPFLPCSSNILLGVVPGAAPLVIEIATKQPVTMLPTSMPPRPAASRITPTRIGEMTGSSQAPSSS